MGNVRIDPLLKEIASVFTDHGYSVYLVGGAVRDMLMGKTPDDVDLATSARPEQVQGLFRRVIPTGIKHGTVTILYKGGSFETTTFRTEAGYTDGRHPDEIAFATTIEEDLSRRDFTMNSIAVELPCGRIVDPYDGESDIKARRIRCVGDPLERFNEDGLRAIRAARFASQLEFTIDERTKAAISSCLNKTAGVAMERVQTELDKLLVSRCPSVGLRIMEETGLLALLFPELAACRGVEQKGFHRFDVLDHLFLSCDGAPRDRLAVRMAALLHDIGKPAVRDMGADGVWTFYRHEEVSTRMARTLMERLRYPTVAIEKVSHLVAMHMFHYEEHWTDAAVRRFVQRVGIDYLPDLYALRRADLYGTAGIIPSPEVLLPLYDRVESVLAAGGVLSIKDLAVTGNDLMGIGVERGPRMGLILKELLDCVLDDPSMNERDTLLNVARQREAERQKGITGSDCT